MESGVNGKLFAAHLFQHRLDRHGSVSEGIVRSLSADDVLAALHFLSVNRR